jgi:hypothetical protein
MKNPRVGQRVWAENLTGTFTVMAVDTGHSLADLQSTDAGNTREMRVALSLVHAVGGDHSPVSKD